MSGGSPSGLLILTFGDLDGGTWGAAWGGATPFFAVGDADMDAVVASAEIDGVDDAEDWRLAADGADLTISPEGLASPASADDVALAGFDQLCRVRGRIAAVDGAIRELDCLGRRGARAQLPDPRRFESVRDVSAWFGPDDGIVLSAARPRRAAGHAGDLVTATVFDPEGPLVVADPRLSTTYTSAGWPSRVGLELWLDDPGSDDESGGAQYPRRIAGEGSGGRAVGSVDQLEIRATRLRCHARGRDGAGVYLLARVR
jgi:hypothetical protein